MSDPIAIVIAVAGLLLLAVAAYVLKKVGRGVRERGMHLWVPAWVFPSEARPSVSDEPLDVFLAVCDHYEPEWSTNPAQPAPFDVAMDRVRHWVREYPRLFDDVRDANGRPPQHTCFYPQDQYRPEYLDALAELCAGGWGDVDIHLHHDDDTAEGLRSKLSEFRDDLFHRHGLLRRDPQTGEIVYGFIHGNWSLCNSRPDGRWCGVDAEIPVLLETGCYADFTLPSAPSPTQTRTINSIYYANDRPGRRKSHDTGVRARVGSTPPDNALLMIQGPLLPDWSRRKLGVLPRVENGDLQANHPPTMERWPLWLQADVHVAGRPNWRFIKLHTHGCKSGNLEMLLSDRYRQFHLDLHHHCRRQENIRLHYVTAWEMATLVHQAEQGVDRPVLRGQQPCNMPIPVGI